MDSDNLNLINDLRVEVQNEREKRIYLESEYYKVKS